MVKEIIVKMSKFIVLNHKMNLEYDQIFSYIEQINKIDSSNNIIVCPSNIYLMEFMNHCIWGVGSQNVHSSLDGNYTGEVSTLQLKSLGVEYSMIGHYERKKYFHESILDVKDKLNACLDANISPILCFGETGRNEDIIKDLDVLLEGISNIDFILFAYEPLKVSKGESIDEIQDKTKFIYDYLYNKYQSRPNIIYGGGVSSKDIKELLNNEYISGILIGKISSDIEKIEKIIKKIS